ncbi:MAG: hypothetical protein LLF76_10845 [Planctomycetaceae bacterium]|nr:hypothetical protein [Planctomycetaceae bacterium]
MIGKRVKLIKRSDVEVSGSTHLPESAGARKTVRPPATACAAQQARIIESNSEYAILEVCCSCGAKSHIQCNYANVHEGSQT